MPVSPHVAAAVAAQNTIIRDLAEQGWYPAMVYFLEDLPSPSRARYLMTDGNIGDQETRDHCVWVAPRTPNSTRSIIETIEQYARDRGMYCRDVPVFAQGSDTIPFGFYIVTDFATATTAYVDTQLVVERAS